MMQWFVAATSAFLVFLMYTKTDWSTGTKPLPSSTARIGLKDETKTPAIRRNARGAANGRQLLSGRAQLKRESKALSSDTVLYPKITEERAQAALGSLDAKHEWKKNVQFMGIGAPKCGSTSVYAYLRKHNMTRFNCKECQCFLYDWNSSDPDCERHYRISNEASTIEDHIGGDFSPGYLAHSEFVIPRIAAAYPWIKLLAILRDPASRAFSQYYMRMKNGKTNYSFEEYVLGDLEALRLSGMFPHWKFETPSSESVSFEEWMSAPVDESGFNAFFGSEEMALAWRRYHQTKRSPYYRSVSTGLYAVSFHRWLSVFPRDRFLVLNLNDMSTEGGADQVMSRVYHFLDMSPNPITDTRLANRGSYRSPMPERINMLLQRIYAPFTAKLEVLFGEEWKDPFPSTPAATDTSRR